MAQGPAITDEVKMLIARLHKMHPKWTNSMIRNEVSSVVRQRDESLSKGWPSKYSIDRIMPGIRERARLKRLHPDPLDRPWTIYSMSRSEFCIPAEALPSVLEAWAFCQDSGTDLTMREAQWAARLSAAIKDTENLCWHAISMARLAWQAEEAGIEDYMGSQSDNLHVYSTMTGHVITREQERKLSGLSKEQWRRMEKAWPAIRDRVTAEVAGGARLFRSGMHFEKQELFEGIENTALGGFFSYTRELIRADIRPKKLKETEPSQRGAKNERINKAKKQK